MKGPELRSNARTVLLVVAILGGTAWALMHYLSGPVLAGTAGEPTKCVCGDESEQAAQPSASTAPNPTPTPAPTTTRALESAPSVPLAASPSAPSLATSHS